ncbi:type I secretion system permease/ATPase [Kineobactrum salinum]|uniref:Type I secretion system permease/ATPase n=1 Tax=Kineobactrum salinum TaxID=2708301 RepID=A0A6C0TYN0_9GAMM|nr:type I secretion system permease/ATPase [Kineobactrum salinum]QIB64748.1 type I secretion system permease/ATPase [Kineobactrum salinum]
MTASGQHGELYRALAGCRSSLLAVALFSCGINLLLLAPAIYMLQVYDRVITSGSIPTLLMLTLVVLLMFLTIGALEWVRGQILLRLGLRLQLLLDQRVFGLSFREALYTGGKAAQGQALTDLAGLRQYIAGSGPVALFDAPWLPVYLLVLYLLHPLFGLVALVSAAVLLGLALLNANLSRAPLQEAGAASLDSNAFVVKNLRNAEVVESMGMLADVRRHWQQLHYRVLASQTRASARAGLLASVSRVFRLAVQSLILGLGAWLVIDQRITPGVMIAGSILLGRALAPVDMVIGSWRQWVQARLHYQRLQELLSRIPERRQRMSLPAPKGLVAAENVSLAPPGQRFLVVRNASFRIEPGEAVALIGPSASGKTSLARAILGIWPTTTGSMRLDGAEIFSWDRAELGPHVGYLPQDVELFDGSVSANIARFGEIDPARVVAAAKLASVHDAILRLPQGYDMEIGDAGSALSAGQRQRLALARALYGNPQLIVLDEPNSNLDDEGEHALINALRAEKQRGATIIVISHRNTILAAVDKLLVLKEGRVVLYGPKAEVLAKMDTQRSAALARRQAAGSGTTSG